MRRNGIPIALFFMFFTLSIGLPAAHLRSMAQEATPEATPETTPEAPIIEGAIGPDDYESTVNPLTGLPVDDVARLERRPIVVKASNNPAIVRPQAGIGAADLAFEHYTEAGITRFSTIFYSQAPERVGSIRSARLIDYELVPMYQGLLAFAGASVGVDKRIYGSEAVAAFYCNSTQAFNSCLAGVNATGPAGNLPPSEFADRAYKGVLFGRPYYFRDEGVPVPHNLFVNPQALWELAAENGQAERPDLRGMAFHAEPQSTPTGSGIYAQVRYQTSLVEWHYDPDTTQYYRSTDGQLHLDANTEEQVSAANVVIIYAGHYLTDIVESEYQGNINWSVQITVWPEGDAVILRDGVRYEGRWLRPSRAELLSFQTDEGEILYLKPGNTWFQLVQLPEQMDPEREWVIIE